MPRVLFVFIDGVGLGADDPAVNALAAARLPTFERLLGGRRPTLPAATRAAAPRHADGSPPAARTGPTGDAGAAGDVATATLVALDASLGVDGLPQSGTGQAALLTGVNAAARFGRHYGPWVPTALRPLVADESVLARAKRAGLRVAFANAYPEEAVDPPPASARRSRRSPLRAGPPLAALGAGLLTRHTAALARGDAVASEITNDGWRARLGRREVPEISAAEAGRNLGRIAAAHDLTLYAHYTTDTAGHHRDLAAAIHAIERVDTFLGGVLETLPADTLLLVASDHGNLEDARVGHTRNPALALVHGAGHAAAAGRLRALTDVAGVALGTVGAEFRDRGRRGQGREMASDADEP
ncbi:MAG TPA: alkaline phosphatase family protein [Longimicrobiales bacterium]